MAGDLTGRTRHIYIVAAEYSNPEPKRPREVLSYRGEEKRTVLKLMEQACSNTLDGLPYEQGMRAVTHVYGVTMPGDREPAPRQHPFYGLRSKLRLMNGCAMHLETGSSDGGAVALTSAWELLRGRDRPGTALVVAGQYLSPETLRNPRDFVAQVIDPPERTCGLNMIPMGDFTMDAIAQWSSHASIRPSTLATDTGLRAFLQRWLANKLKLAKEYLPSQRGRRDTDVSDAPQARWLRSPYTAQPSVGACAVILTTSRTIVEHVLKAKDSRGRVVRLIGVGIGDADERVTARDEPLMFFRAMRQALSTLRRETGYNLDHLRAASFGVLHDAFPSIELAAMVSLGLSPIDIEQRALSYWPNPYGGLIGMGHAFAASGLVQIAKAYHTLHHPDRFFEEEKKGTYHPRFQHAVSPLHVVTVSVGGPMAHVVATEIESIVPGSEGFDAPCAIPERHRLEEADSFPFEEKALRVGELVRSYSHGLNGTLVPAGAGVEERLCVLEARSLLRLDSVTPEMLPLFQSDAEWAPEEVVWRGTSMAIERVKAAAVGKLLASGTEADASALYKSFRAIVDEEAKRMFDPSGPLLRKGEPVEEALGELRGHVWTALGVPVGYVLLPTPKKPADGEPLPAVHGMCVLTQSARAAVIGDVLTLVSTPTNSPARSAHLPRAKALDAALPGLRPPWLTSIPQGGGHNWSDELVTKVGSLLDQVRGVHPYAALSGLYDLAADAIGEVTALPLVAPPEGFARLLRELVLSPDEDWHAIAGALELMYKGTDHQTPPLPRARRYAMQCVFDIVGASALGSPAALRRQIDVVHRAIRRAEAWLEGLQPTHARLGDMFGVSAEFSTNEWAHRWGPIVSFARDVYQHCREHSVPVRAVLGVGESVRVETIDRNASSALSQVFFAVDRVAELASGDNFKNHFVGSSREGVIIVLDRRGVDVIADNPPPKTNDLVAFAFETIWKTVGGEPLTIVGTHNASYGTRQHSVPDLVVYYQLRALPTNAPANAATSSQSRPDLLSQARRILATLYADESSIRRFLQDARLWTIESRVAFTGGADAMWGSVLTALVRGDAPAPSDDYVDDFSGDKTIVHVLKCASSDKPGNGMLKSMISSFGDS